MRTYWREIEDILRTQDYVTINDLAMRIGKGEKTAANALKAFYEKGFLYMEKDSQDNRKKLYFQPKIANKRQFTFLPLSMSDLEKETEKWLEAYSVKKPLKTLNKIFDPITGKIVSPREIFSLSTSKHETSSDQEKKFESGEKRKQHNFANSKKPWLKESVRRPVP